jgi:phosphoserine phosphatase
MRVYDFDGTIYDGDSTKEFYIYCLLRYPKCIIAFPCFMSGAVLYLLGRIDKTELKERYFSFLHYIPNVSDAVEEFWESRGHKIKSWYIERKQDTDIIISASPEFLLIPICRKLNVTLIGSQVDDRTGQFQGSNCHDSEKVRRLKEYVDISAVSAFYSDSLTDNALAELIPNSFYVVKNRITPWTKL